MRVTWRTPVSIAMPDYTPDLIIVRAAAEQALQLSDADYNVRLIEQVLDRRAAVQASAPEMLTLIQRDLLVQTILAARPYESAPPTGSADDYDPDRLIGTMMAAQRHANHGVRALLQMVLDDRPILPSDTVMRGQARRSLERVDRELKRQVESATLVRPADCGGDLLVRPATPPAGASNPDHLLRPGE